MNLIDAAVKAVAAGEVWTHLKRKLGMKTMASVIKELRMSKITNAAVGITGRIVGDEPDNEADHFYICAECGQAIDKRDLGQVFHHEEPGHDPHDIDA